MQRVSEASVSVDGKVTGLRVRDVNDDTTRDLDVTGVFVAIGHDPRSELFRGQLDMDEQGYLLVDQPSDDADESCRAGKRSLAQQARGPGENRASLIRCPGAPERESPRRGVQRPIQVRRCRQR